MDCHEIANLLDDYIDGSLPPAQASAVERHADNCPSCAAAVAGARDLLARLRSLPAPEPDRELFERAIAIAVEREHRRKRRLWLGPGAMLAASLVLVIGIGAHFHQTPTPALQEVPGFTIGLHEVREISLVVESADRIDAATFTVRLPSGIELAGYPGSSEVSWEGRLEPGENLLVLPVTANNGEGGDIVTRVAHTGKHKSFTVRMNVTAERNPDGLSPPAEPLTRM